MACNQTVLLVSQLYISNAGVTSASGLPPGLSFPSAFGADRIGGWPTTEGHYDGLVNGVATYWTVMLSGSTASWTPTSATTLQFTEEEFGTYTLTPINSVGNVSWFIYNEFYPLCPPLVNDLPEGLTFSGGVVSGTPDPGTAGTYQVEIGYYDEDYHTPIGYMTIGVAASGGGGGDETRSVSDSSVGLLLDEIAYEITEEGAVLEGDNISLTDSVSTATTSISGGGSGNFGGTAGGSGGFPGGGPTNAPEYCIFEFYEMMVPENVETLPVPKRYDQLGPMRFDKIAKCFGFRIRLIMNGSTTSMPFELYGDDSVSNPHYGNLLFSGSFTTFPGIDYVYEIQFPKNVNSDIIRLVIGPTSDSFHRYDVLMKVQTSGMQGHSKWMPIR
jgi:hypothetical protein